MSEDKKSCAFCGRTNEVVWMVANDRAAICLGCIQAVLLHLSQDYAEKAEVVREVGEKIDALRQEIENG
jgi:hypothetical protein